MAETLRVGIGGPVGAGLAGPLRGQRVAERHLPELDEVRGLDPLLGLQAPGHQELELALCKLYRVTGDEKYLDQAKFFLDQRGRLGHRGPDGRVGLYGTYGQDHIPVT